MQLILSPVLIITAILFVKFVTVSMCLRYRVVDNPITKTQMMVPCRRCSLCRVGKISFLEKLCDFETIDCYKRGKFSSFVTITLRDEQITHCGLCREQYVRILDHLRVRHSRLGFGKFKFIGCGEYGDITSRPHYHFVLFGANPQDVDCILRDIWKNAIYQVGYLVSGGTRYVLDYIMTNSNSLEDANNQVFLDQGLCPPFFTKSKNLGINYLETEIIPFYREHGYYLDRGKKVILPSYYTNKYGLSSDYSVIEPMNVEEASLRAKALRTKFRSKGKPFEDFHLTEAVKEYYNFLTYRKY